MSLRSIAFLATLIVLQLCGCTTANKPSDPATNALERNHDEMMKRMGGGSGSM
jgi:cytochrome c556